MDDELTKARFVGFKNFIIKQNVTSLVIFSQEFGNQTGNIMQQKKETKAADVKRTKEERERKLDEEIEQTFPASDPPSYSQPHNEPKEKEEDE